jgi:hypothetical protein
MPWCIENHELSTLSLKEILAYVDCHTTLPLFLLLVEEVRELET